MKVEQIYTGCIAHAAYYIESNGVAAVFDPLREIQPYIDLAKIDNAEIKYVFETHFHADFVSGHLDLTNATAMAAFMLLLTILAIVAQIAPQSRSRSG